MPRYNTPEELGTNQEIDQGVNQSGRGPQNAARTNAAYRLARRQFREACKAGGGFVTAGDKCLIGQAAIDHIEGLGPNHPAYDRGQQWLEDNPVDITEEDTTQDQTEELIELEDYVDNVTEEEIDDEVQAVLDGDLNSIYDILVDEENFDPDEAQDLIGDVIADPTTQSAVTLENAINNAGYYVVDGILQTPSEAGQVAYGDTDGDGIVDSSIRVSPYSVLDENVIRGGSIRPELEAAIEQSIRDQEQREAEEAAAEEEEETPPFTVGGALEDAVEDVKEAFPTWEDLWGRIKDVLPDNPQEWGGVIRGVIEAAGVNLPSGDIWDILNGGYGVTTDINPATGGIAGILDPSNQMIFVPGVPVGLPPSSFIIGSVEDVFTQPGQVLTDLKDKVVGVLEGVVNDPVGAAGQILSGTLDVPPELWEVIVGGATLGGDLLDWLENTFEGGDEEVAQEQETTPPVSSGEQPEEEVAETTVEPRETLQEKTMGLLGAFRGGLTQPEKTTPEAVTGGGLTFGGGSVVENGIQYDQRGDLVLTDVGGEEEEEIIQENFTEDGNDTTDIYSGNDCLTFGGGSCAGSDGPTTLFSENLDEPTTQEPTLFSGSSGGGGGGAGGFGGGKAEEYWKGIPYRLPEMQTVQAGPVQKPLSMENLFAQWLGSIA